MGKSIFSIAIREAVKGRASGCCEYCMSQDRYSPNVFTIDHILPESLGGSKDLENLAYACFLCNRLKSNKLKTIDLATDVWVSLFNPRIDVWKDHFSWSDDLTVIIGISMTGRATVSALQLY